MLLFFVSFLLGACGPKSPTAETTPTQRTGDVASESSEKETNPVQDTSPLLAAEPKPTGPDLSRVLNQPTLAFPTSFRADWPPKAWVSAKAYTFNFQRIGVSKLLVYDGNWNETIQQTIPISKEAAEAALELTHRTAGQVLASKCPLPRHAVVYFDAAGEPVASVNVCFSCSDIMVWPPYGPESLRSKKYADWQKMESIHAHVLSRWQLFFDGIGAATYLGN